MSRWRLSGKSYTNWECRRKGGYDRGGYDRTWPAAEVTVNAWYFRLLGNTGSSRLWLDSTLMTLCRPTPFWHGTELHRRVS
jgi:hypothetical protein